VASNLFRVFRNQPAVEEEMCPTPFLTELNSGVLKLHYFKSWLNFQIIVHRCMDLLIYLQSKDENTER
jgi:hypothetical protein